MKGKENLSEILARLLVNKHIHHHILGDRARQNYRRPSTYIRNCGDAQQKRELHTDGLG